MAKALHEVNNVVAFPMARIVQFPLTQYCGCGCGMLLNINEHSFIRSEETGQWYVDEYDFLKALNVVERNGRYRFKLGEYWYSKSEFYAEMKAYWMNEYQPIA